MWYIHTYVVCIITEYKKGQQARKTNFVAPSLQGIVLLVSRQACNLGVGDVQEDLFSSRPSQVSSLSAG